jgi:hypothetical protein
MVTLTDWNGILAGRRRSGAEITLRAPLRQGSTGGSGAFLGLADDGRHYWIKTLNNGQSSPRVPITEQIVGRVGRMIGGPMCEVRTIAILPEHAGWEFRPGLRLEAGIAHGSYEVEGCVQTGALSNRADDENARRHAYILAIHDWCWAQDLQWLVAEADDHRYYSHDHGHYFPSGPGWSADELQRRVDEAHEMADPDTNLDVGAIDGICGALGGLSRDAIAAPLAAIPAEWPITDNELECVGFFLEMRAPQVAERLRRRFGRIL